MDTKIDFEDILIFPIDSPEFLQCANGLRMPSSIVNWKALLDIVDEFNQQYCEDNNLCTTCRSELEEVYESRGEHFGTPSREKVKYCPRCG